jgi:sodium/proline symporter
MSTADSQLLVAASSFASDLYKPMIRKNASNKEMLWVSRIIVLVIAVVAYFIASSKGEAAQAIMDLVSNAWGIFGAAFGPTVLLSIFWKRFTYKGAVAGIIVGAVVDMLWLWLPVSDGLTLYAVTGVYEIIPGFIASAIAAVVVTLIDKAPSQEVNAIYERATDDSIDD